MYTEKQGVKNGTQHLFNSLWCSAGMAEEGLDDTTGLGDLRDPPKATVGMGTMLE